MIDIIGDIGFLVEEVIIASVLGGLGYLVAHFRKKGNDVNKLRDELEKIRKIQWRISKTVIILTKLIDERSNKLHKDIPSDLEDIAKELIGDTNGRKTAI